MAPPRHNNRQDRHHRHTGNVDLTDSGFMDHPVAVQERQLVAHLRGHQPIELIFGEHHLDGVEVRLARPQKI